MSNFADGLFPSWLSFVMLLPFLMMVFGLWFICRAFTDRGGARQEPEPEDDHRSRVVVPLPDRAQQPLYRVHQQIQASARTSPRARPAAAPAGDGITAPPPGWSCAARPCERATATASKGACARWEAISSPSGSSWPRWCASPP